MLENSLLADRRLDVKGRIDNYRRTFPDYAPLQIWNGRIYGIWIIGSMYGKDSDYYGAYPHSVKKRILSLFPDCQKVLHLFSETVHDEGAITYDIKASNNPTICDDVRNITKHKDELADVDLIMADPPYGKEEFAKYGVEVFNKTKVMSDLGKVAKAGCCLAWFDQFVPMYKRETWALMGYIGLIIGTNTRIRCLSLFQRTGR